jgi:hypothetical protein
MILITILGLVLGWREVQILCERNSWDFQDFRNWFWNIDSTSRWKNFDSFHVSNGLAVLIISMMFYNGYVILELASDIWNIISNVIFYWFYIFWIRNIMMHVIMPKKPKWKYLIPLL